MQQRSIALATLAFLTLLLALYGCNRFEATAPSPVPPPSEPPSTTPPPPGSGPVTGRAENGGLLYDKWWAFNGSAEPTTTHPAYPSSGAQSGSGTWRCKECHGWDYQGAAGAYGSGSHFTGIRGVLGARDQAAETIFNQIKSGQNHDFSAGLSDENINDLVAFIKEGTINMNEWIDFNSKRALGDAGTGQPLWQQQCQGCHGGSSGPITELAVENPWESLHKNRWGHAGAGMPSMVVEGLTTQQQVDILTYSQSIN